MINCFGKKDSLHDIQIDQELSKQVDCSELKDGITSPLTESHKRELLSKERKNQRRQGSFRLEDRNKKRRAGIPERYDSFRHPPQSVTS